MAPALVVQAASTTAAHLVCRLPGKGDGVCAESDAAVAWRGNVQLEGAAGGQGLLASVMRSLLGGESFFVQRWRAAADASGAVNEVVLAPQHQGDVAVIPVTPGDDVLLVQGAFLASETAVAVSGDAQELRRIFTSALAKTGFFVLRASGRGALAITGPGVLRQVRLAHGERLSVDNGHLVAWSASVGMRVGLATGGVVASVTSGEGLACHFEGPGLVVYATHKPPDESARKSGKEAVSTFAVCVFLCVFLAMFCLVVGAIGYTIYTGGGGGGGGAFAGARASRARLPRPRVRPGADL